MKKSAACLFALYFFCAASSLFSQKLIALHHAGTSSFYTNLQDAYNAAVNGDTIYIPGGNFGGLSLQKSLTLIGAGHDPDSTAASGMTILAYLHIYEEADNSFITGIRFNDPIQTFQNVSNVTICRCYFSQGIFFSGGQKTNWIVYENYMGIAPGYGACFYNGGNVNDLTGFLLTNNVFSATVYGLSSSEIRNNILIQGYFYAHVSLIKNNILSSNSEPNSSYSQWDNNLNAGINGGPSGANNTGSGNYLDNAPLTSVFNNYAPGNNFYQNDFHVVNPAYLGDDGAPVGIYGGPFPWKEGSLPANPHIKTKMISSTTNPDGTLQINITVNAQDH